MPTENKAGNQFKELTWRDLQEWAGEKATAKGIKYQEEGRVEEIKSTSEGSLVARVEGTKEYFTEIFLKDGKLSSICTCPVEYNCKHGIAAVLEYLEQIEQGEEIPVIEKNIEEKDPLVARARRRYEGYETSGIYEADESSIQTLRNYLERLEKKELIEILLSFVHEDSELDRYLRYRQSLESGNTD